MKRFTTLLATFACTLLAACTSMPVGNPKVPEPAKSVQIDRYTGLWHEIARYQNSFEKGCEAVTAQYDALDDGRISILNSCHKGSVIGPLTTAAGKAKVVEGSNNTKLKVSFFGPFYLGDYWVLDHADDYSWSIVGNPLAAISGFLPAAHILTKSWWMSYTPGFVTWAMTSAFCGW